MADHVFMGRCPDCKRTVKMTRVKNGTKILEWRGKCSAGHGIILMSHPVVPDDSPANDGRCPVQPEGWGRCTREAGHEGPCAIPHQIELYDDGA